MMLYIRKSKLRPTMMAGQEEEAQDARSVEVVSTAPPTRKTNNPGRETRMMDPACLTMMRT